MFKLDHFNFNVKDLDVSLKFYQEIIGLQIIREQINEEKGFKIIFLGDSKTDFKLELTWLKDHAEAYDLGEQEYHLAFTAENFNTAHKKHKDAGLICFENTDMGIYFLEDPDGYWIEIIPPKK